ncbi:MAG: alkaline phosphatase D family protein, partial [Gaiella sp.]
MLRLAAAVTVAATLGVGVLAAGAGGAEAPFAQGVAAGEVTQSSALLWTRAPRTGGIEVSGACVARGRTTPLRGSARASAADDRTVSIRIGGLP